MRRPTLPERILQALLLAAFLVAAWNFVTAMTGVACRNPAELDAGYCYPWGWEAFGGFWHFRSQRNYLLSAALNAFVLALSIGLPFVVKSRWISILAMLAVSLGGTIALPWLPYFMGW